MSKFRLMGAGATVAIALASAMPAWAQDATTASAAAPAQDTAGQADPNDTTRDIVVTAQGRAQLLSDVPVRLTNSLSASDAFPTPQALIQRRLD